MGKTFAKMREQLIVIKTLTVRKFPTIYHERAWQNYERILIYRANMSQFLALLYFVSFWSASMDRTHTSKKFLDDGESKNPEL